MSEPQPLPLNYAEPATPRRRRIDWFEVARWCSIFGWVACAIAWGLVLMADTESVLVTGPILVAIGSATIAAAVRSHFTWAMVNGTGQCSLCATLFMLVLMFGWGPDTARTPFLAIGAAYIVLTALPTILVIAARDGRR